MQDSTDTPAATASRNLYRAGAASALALGAGLAGLSEAQATVILTDVNAEVSDDVQDFDVNDDGIDELTIQDLAGKFASAEGGPSLKVAFTFLDPDKPFFLTRFDYGDTIGIATFGPSTKEAFFYTKTFYSKDKGSDIITKGLSPWEDGERGFFGIFMPEGTIKKGGYFGYVEAQFSPGNTVTIFRIGFEDELNTPITIRNATQVPEPGGIGLLALGAAGILAYRRRQRKQAATA